MIEAFPLIRLVIINNIFLLAKLNYREWLKFCIAELRLENRNNMRYIGISEKEVMDFTNDLGAADDYEEEILNQVDFEKPDIDVDSVTANHAFVRQIDSLLRVK